MGGGFGDGFRAGISAGEGAHLSELRPKCHLGGRLLRLRRLRHLGRRRSGSLRRMARLVTHG